MTSRGARRANDRPRTAAATAVKIAAAKGRPMLSWVGKRPLREVRAFPAQAVERFSAAGAAASSVSAEVEWSGWPDRHERGGLLFHGDNKEVLAHLGGAQPVCPDTERARRRSRVAFSRLQHLRNHEF